MNHLLKDSREKCKSREHRCYIVNLCIMFPNVLSLKETELTPSGWPGSGDNCHYMNEM